jgi:hypothetical protein
MIKDWVLWLTYNNCKKKKKTTRQAQKAEPKKQNKTVRKNKIIQNKLTKKNHKDQIKQNKNQLALRFLLSRRQLWFLFVFLRLNCLL